MSHAGNIPGMSDLEVEWVEWVERVERVEQDQGIEVYARPTKRPLCIHCQHNGVKIKATYQRTLRHTRMGNQVMTLHLMSPKYHCPQ